MAVVMIGVDPHQGSHTAVAIDAAEVPLGELRMRSSADQAGKLLEWAAEWPERTWAVEGAGGLGHVLAQQLLAAGEQVLDAQPKLGARVRLLSSGTPDKNNPDDARSVAVAALRSPACCQVRGDDHAAVLRVWSRRHRQLSRLRTQAACRLHAVLCEITPSGVPENITANRAAAILAGHRPVGPVQAAWHDLADEHLADLRRLDITLSEARTKLTVAVRASGTTLTEVFGVGPVAAATVIGRRRRHHPVPEARHESGCAAAGVGRSQPVPNMASPKVRTPFDGFGCDGDDASGSARRRCCRGNKRRGAGGHGRGHRRCECGTQGGRGGQRACAGVGGCAMVSQPAGCSDAARGGGGLDGYRRRATSPSWMTSRNPRRGIRTVVHRTAHANPAFRAELGEVQHNTGRSLDTLRGVSARHDRCGRFGRPPGRDVPPSKGDPCSLTNSRPRWR